MINCGSGSGSSSGLPCGTCKFLRRKCVPDCIFAPYFGCEQGAARFAAIHKIFGASSVSKLLLHVPVLDKFEAVVTIAYEAQARIRDPIYGCVEHFFTLQQQAAMLQAQLMQVRAQLAHGMAWQDLGRLSINGNGTLKLTPIRTQIYSPCLSRARPIAAAMGFWCKRCVLRGGYLRTSLHKEESTTQ